MRSREFASPTIIHITDRADLDTQLSEQFGTAKKFIGDDCVVEVESRAKLREYLAGRTSGGVFLTTIHKFTEDTLLLSKRANIICISDEAHRSQTNLSLQVRQTESGVKRRGEEDVLMNRHLHIKAKELLDGATPASTPTSVIPESENVKRLISAIAEKQLSVKEIMTAVGLKDRPNFIEYSLSPAMREGYVRMLYPDSPRHPRQKYLLTVKGLAAYKELPR